MANIPANVKQLYYDIRGKFARNDTIAQKNPIINLKGTFFRTDRAQILHACADRDQIGSQLKKKMTHGVGQCTFVTVLVLTLASSARWRSA